MGHLRLLSVVAVLAAAGCGRPSLSVDETAGDAGGPGGGPPHGSGGAGAAGSGGATGEGPGLVVGIADEILYVSPDGASVRSVHRIAAPDITGTALVHGWIGVNAHDDHVIAVRSVGAYDMSAGSPASTEGWQQGDRAVLLDGKGAVLWEKSFSTRELGPSHSRAFSGTVGQGGNVVLLVGWQHLFVAPDGQEHPIDGIRSAFPPVPGPVVPVVSDGATVTTSRVGWWRPGQPIDHLPLEAEVIFHVSGTEPRIVFGSTDVAGRRVVVDARPSGFETRPWPSDAELPGRSFASGDWRGTDDGAEVVRWNALTGEMARLPWALPAGMRRLAGPFFGAGGALVVALRNDYMAGVYISTAAGPDWVLLGKTLGGIETVEVGEIGGTYVIDTQGTNDFFVPQQRWQPAPAGEEPALAGRTHQIVRPADGISVEANPPLWRISLSPDGLRALYWETAPGGYTLVMHDLISGTKRPLAFRSYPGSYNASWIR